jgi:uncharacterized membrane protein YbhN (UPF0104 family)
VGRTIWAWVRVLAGAGIIVLLLWRLGTGAFVDGLRVIDSRMLVAALGIGALTTVVSAWRWCLVAQGLGVRLPLRSAVADYYRSLFLNAALPGGILGDVHRAVRHGRETGDVGRGIRAVVLERSAGQIALITAGLAVLLASPARMLPGIGDVVPRWTIPVGIATGAVFAVILIWGRRNRESRRAPTSRLGRGLRTAGSDIRRGLLSKRLLPWIACSSAIVLAGHLATFVIAARAAGATAPLTRLLPMMLLALVAMALPLNVGGWGPREGVMAWAFGAAGLGAAQGLTVAVVYGLFAFVASLPGIAVLIGQWIIRSRAARREARAVVSVASAGEPLSLVATGVDWLAIDRGDQPDADESADESAGDPMPRNAPTAHTATGPRRRSGGPRPALPGGRDTRGRRRPPRSGARANHRRSAARPPDRARRRGQR